MAKQAKKFTVSLKHIFVFPLSPRRQFRRLLIALLVLFVGVTAFHMYFFKHIETESFFKVAVPTDTGGAPIINEKKFTAILQRFEDKAALRESIPTSTPLVSEPSK